MNNSSIGGGKRPDDPTENKVSRRRSIFETLFIRYGAGSGIFLPLTRLKSWNIIAWVLIAIGVLAWILAWWWSSNVAGR